MNRLDLRFLVLPVLSLVPLSCSHDASDPNQTGEQWDRLIDGTWSLEPGTEDTRWCKKIVLTEDTYVSAIRPVHPPGTHHTTLALVDDDGTTACKAGFATGLIYAAGAGTNDLRMPNGVAMKMAAGKAVVLGLHIFNTTAQTLSGLSGIDVIRAKPEDVTTEADMLIAGPISFSLPPLLETTISATCKVSTDQTAFTLFPHMHQLGIHIKTTATLAGTPMVLHDGDYQFNEQYQLPIGPIAFHAGDAVTTECTYQNTRTTAVGFGESTDTEMCFSVIFRYPSGGAGFCTGAQDMQLSDGGAMISGPPCAAIGAPGNDNGVGKYCTAGGGECGTGSPAPICIADYTSSAFGDFCTTQCQADTDCGAGAVCTGSSTKVCIPSSCVKSPADGGADGG